MIFFISHVAYDINRNEIVYWAVTFAISNKDLGISDFIFFDDLDEPRNKR